MSAPTILTTSSVTKYFYLAGWRGINIEPIPELVEKLNKSRPEDTNKGVAISDRPGELPFYKGVKASGLSTLSPKIAASHRAKGFEFTKIMIPVTTLNAVLDEHAKDKSEITFLNVDVEGFEKQVLSSIDFKRYHPRVIMAESTAPLTEVATHQKWESILIDNGYIFAMDDGLNRYYVHKQRGEPPPEVHRGRLLRAAGQAGQAPPSGRLRAPVSHLPRTCGESCPRSRQLVE